MRNKVRVKFDGRQLDIDFRADGGYVVAPGSVHHSQFAGLRGDAENNSGDALMAVEPLQWSAARGLAPIAVRCRNSDQ